jgi:hypothetical protein
MPSVQIPCVEMLYLRVLSDLEQLEASWMDLMESKEPESVALAFRLALVHLAQSSKRLQVAGVIQQAEESIDCKREHGAAKA